MTEELKIPEKATNLGNPISIEHSTLEGQNLIIIKVVEIKEEILRVDFYLWGSLEPQIRDSILETIRKHYG